jgi:hypothetical protein
VLCLPALLSRPDFRPRCGGAEAAAPLQFGHQQIDDVLQQESQAVAYSFRLLPAVRNDALRQYGKQMFRRRFTPLVAAQ